MTTDTIRIFVIRAGEAEPKALVFEPDATIEKLLEQFRDSGAEGEELFLFKEDGDKCLEAHLTLSQADIGKGCRLHVHHHRLIDVTVHYSDKSPSKDFAPGSTVHRVKEWAEKEFHIHDDDTVEYALQICESTTKPPESVHIGTLVHGECKKLCFDLKPHPKVNG